MEIKKNKVIMEILITLKIHFKIIKKETEMKKAQMSKTLKVRRLHLKPSIKVRKLKMMMKIIKALEIMNQI